MMYYSRIRPTSYIVSISINVGCIRENIPDQCRMCSRIRSIWIQRRMQDVFVNNTMQDLFANTCYIVFANTSTLYSRLRCIREHILHPTLYPYQSMYDVFANTSYILHCIHIDQCRMCSRIRSIWIRCSIQHVFVNNTMQDLFANTSSIQRIHPTFSEYVRQRIYIGISHIDEYQYTFAVGCIRQRIHEHHSKICIHSEIYICVYDISINIDIHSLSDDIHSLSDVFASEYAIERRQRRSIRYRIDIRYRRLYE